MWIETYTIRLACRHCLTDEASALSSLVPVSRAGWTNIVEDPLTERSTFHHWWTHKGTCPRCSDLDETI